MKTRVRFEVLTDKNGNVRKYQNIADCRMTWAEAGFLGYTIEVRELFVDGNMRDAFDKACEMGGNPERTFYYN